MDIKVPGEELLKKLCETLGDKGIGGLLRPWQIRRVGRAETDVQVDAKLRLAQAERMAEAIRRGEMSVDGCSTLKLTYNVPQEVIAQENEQTLIAHSVSAGLIEDATRKEINVAKAILHAEEAAKENEEPVSTEEVNPDWLFRWRDSAGEVSDEELQTLWGRILAGEVKTPGTFSLRTLEFLRNLSKIEAEEISKLAPYVVNKAVWRNEDLEKNLSFDYLLKLQEVGVISGVESIGLHQTISSNDSTRFVTVLVGADRALIIEHEDAQKTIRLDCYLLTTVGAEVMKLCAASTDKEYFRTLGRTFVKQGFKVFIGRRLHQLGQLTTWRKEEEITLPE